MTKPETELPSEGGSYLRDPKTGALTRQSEEAPATAGDETPGGESDKGRTTK